MLAAVVSLISFIEATAKIMRATGDYESTVCCPAICFAFSASQSNCSIKLPILTIDRSTAVHIPGIPGAEKLSPILNARPEWSTCSTVFVGRSILCVRIFGR